MNVVVVKGVLSRVPEARELPSGDVVVNYELTVRRPDGLAEGVPVVWYDAGPVDLGTGAEVIVVGRVRRRFFRTGGATQSRTEVVADQVISLANRRRVKAAVGRAGLALERWDQAG